MIHEPKYNMVSDCCGAPDQLINNDASFEDMGLCSECREHYEYVPESDEPNILNELP